MLSFITNFLTRRKVAGDNAKSKKHFVSWSKVERIALIIDESEINKSEIDKFLDSIHKYTEVFYTELQSRQASFGDWNCFTKADKTILRLPKSTLLRELSHKKYDVVLNLSSRNPLFNTQVTSQLNAPFKCGSRNLYGETDVIVERNAMPLPVYLKEVVKCLEMIRTDKKP